MITALLALNGASGWAIAAGSFADFLVDVTIWELLKRVVAA